MKTEISFEKIDGGNGVALVVGTITSDLQAKRELAAKLDLPLVDTPSGEKEDIDARLRNGGIAPASIKFNHISE